MHVRFIVVSAFVYYCKCEDVSKYNPLVTVRNMTEIEIENENTLKNETHQNIEESIDERAEYEDKWKQKEKLIISIGAGFVISFVLSYIAYLAYNFIKNRSSKAGSEAQREINEHNMAT